MIKKKWITDKNYYNTSGTLFYMVPLRCAALRTRTKPGKDSFRSK